MPARVSPLQQRLAGLTARPGAFTDRGVYLGTTIRGAGLAIDTFVPRQTADAGFAQLQGKDSRLFNAVMDARYGAGQWRESWKGSLWKEGVKGSLAVGEQGQRINPLEYLQMAYLGDPNASGKGASTGASGSGGGGGGGGGGGSSAFQNVAYSITNPETAESLVNATLRQYLGREAKPKEQVAFRKALNAFERQNPSVTQGMTTAGGGMSRTTQTSSGGVDQAQFAEDWAQSQEGAGEFQAATQLLDSFMSALDNPLDIVQ
jgi:hypothetical protein